MADCEKAGEQVGARALEHIRHLSVDIGPRGSATEGERRGSEYVAAEMRRWAQDVRTQPFRCYTTYSLPWGLVALLMALSGVLLWLRPLAALLVAIVNLPFYFLLASGRGDVGAIFPKRPSQNVWGKVPAMAPAPAGSGDPAGGPEGLRGGKPRRVVLMAHVDTTRAALLYAPKALKNLRASHTLNLVSVLAVFFLALVGVWAEGIERAGAAGGAARVAAGATGGVVAAAPYVLLVARVLASVFALISVYALATLVHRQLFMPYVHGANDNASGVGLTLAIGEHYAKNPLPNTEIWCVVTGCEESGYPAGARRFVDAHLEELRDAEVIVLDNIGAGDLRHLTEEGIILPLKMDPGLLGLARRLGRGHPHWNVRDSVCNLGYTDATPALCAGLRTIVLWAERPDGFLKNYHWPTDVYENVEPQTVNRAATLVMEMIEAIDRGEDRAEV